MAKSSAYQKLTRIFNRAAGLERRAESHRWTILTRRGSVLRAAAGVICNDVRARNAMAGARVSRLIEDAANQNLTAMERANLAEMTRRHKHAAAETPGGMVRRFIAIARTQQAWEKAKQVGDFEAVRPHFSALIGETARMAKAKGAALGIPPYDALLDQFAPGSRDDRLAALFGQVSAALPGILLPAMQRQKASPPLPLTDKIPVEKQRALANRLMDALGFDRGKGALSETTHPMTRRTAEGVQISLAYDAGNALETIMTTVHEIGHALYEMGLPEELDGQPAGAARGDHVHESMALLYENHVARSPAFWAFAAPLVREVFGVSGPEWSAANLHRLVTQTRPTLQRGQADELTYPAHIQLRWQLEKQLIAGDLAVEDLPGAWRDGMKKLVGIDPGAKSGNELQDIHWYGGVQGYFPNYFLGALGAAQFFEAAERDIPDLQARFAGGDFTALKDWLHENVYQKAATLSEDALFTRATGARLGADAWLRQAKRRYLPQKRPQKHQKHAL